MHDPVLDSVWDAISASDRAPATLRTYKSRLKLLSSCLLFPLPADRSVTDLLDCLNPSMSINTRCVLVNFLLMCSKQHRDFADLIGGTASLDDLRVMCEKGKKERQEYQRQTRPEDVHWEDLLALEPRVQYLPIRDRLIYALYVSPGVGGDVQVVPRNDFANCRIVSDVSECTDPKSNYAVVVPEEDDEQSSFIRLNEYKSSRIYGTVDLSLPASTAALVKKKGGQYLFASRADPSAPTTDHALQRQIQRLFVKLGLKSEGKGRLGVNNLRRAYAQHTSVLLDEDARMRCAHKMGHTLSTHRLYAQEQGAP